MAPSPRKNNICRKFASTGQCTFPNCRYLHEKTGTTDGSPPSPSEPRPDRPDRPKLPCLHFQAHNRCKYGDQCRFSHDPNLPKPDPDSAISLYRGWSQLLGPRPTATAPRGGSVLRELSAEQMERFLNDAWKILTIGTSETVQQLIGDLGSERGLRRIAQVVETEFTPGDDLARPYGLTFRRHCSTFLKVVAHEEMRASLVLEKEVGTVFNFIYGPGGRRGITFFGRVARCLAEMPETEAESGDGVEEALLAAATAFFGALNLNQGAGVQTEFRDIATTLETALTARGTKGPYNYTFRSTQEELGRIKVLLKMADAVPKSMPYRPGQTIPAYHQPRLQVDFPGELSREGPRHDNDHADISKITILPTSEEIRSHRNEYLPQRALEYPHHLEGISRVIDSQFRLLREDTSGQIREAVRSVQNNWKDVVEVVEGAAGGKKKKKQPRTPGVRTLMYTNARIEKLRCAERDGVVMNVTFDQPARVRALGDKERREWWERSKYLAVGSLLCLVDDQRRSTFLVVCDRVVNAADKSRRGGHSVKEEEQSMAVLDQDLSTDPARAMITLRFAGAISENDIENVFKTIDGAVQVLVEFPGLLFTSFDPVLKCLQQVSKTGNIPFSKWLAPAPGNEYGFDSTKQSAYVDVPPPLYMTKPGAELSLKSITGGEPLTYSITNDFRVEELQRTTTLDNGQCEALVASLSRELALIQGPPGTGKSYLGVQIVKILLDNRETTKIGPILCVCYTNHALDQFLEHLLKDGINNIVRIGSRSKSEAVMPFALYNVVRRVEHTRLECEHINKAKANLVEHEQAIQEACEQLLSPLDASILKKYLEGMHPTAYHELFAEEDEEGYQRVGRRGAKPSPRQILEDWIDGRGFFHGQRGLAYTNRPLEQLETLSVTSMSRVEKLKILDHWYSEMNQIASSNLLQAAEAHAMERSNLSRQKQEQQRRCLQDRHVIGVTTTGFATHSDLIRSVSAKVLICEEAAEVLEAHILSALLPTMEHAILIGDHLQLRPQIMNHDFSMENPRGGELYGLDTSLFERTAEIERYNGKKFPVARLDTQRRMHPSIANLIRNTLYSDLIDYPSTANHPEVPGMARRLFWMDHNQPEEGADKLELIQTSHANEFEADMTVQLVRHLSRQGLYKSGEIAVLSPYLRQLFLLRRKLASIVDVVVGDLDQDGLDALEEEGGGGGVIDPQAKQVKKGTLLSEVRVATVDNFQGEEAKVIIISMVRSNKENKCGFLKTSNRINVLLSRAIDGMYIFGNADTCRRVDMWSKILKMLENGSNIGKQLELRCPRHPDQPILISEPPDFHLFSPEGGCDERCEWRLGCGHPCIKKCHSDFLHESTTCFEACNRAFKHCTHPCTKPCGIPCGNCNIKVPGVRLPCGHVPSSLHCHELQEITKIKCHKIVQHSLPACGHELSRECWQDPKNLRCKKQCESILSCGHQCAAMCKSCNREKTQNDQTTIVSVHEQCSRPCGRKYANCSHSCTTTCHGADKCPPCGQQCEIRCEHSRCGKRCTDSCAPCAEVCSWTCVHRDGRCEMPCAVPCDINPCSERCGNQLGCGHRCPSICGERCPPMEFCQVCGDEEVKGRVVDLIMFTPYREIDLDIEPIIVPTCGHFYILESYDSHMGIKNCYLLDGDGKILAPKPLNGNSDPPSVAQADDEPPEKLVIKNCPDCRAPLRDIHRYNRIVKTACLEESTRRFCANAQARYLDMYQDVSRELELLQGNCADFISGLRADKRRDRNTGVIPQLQDRLQKSVILSRKIQRFIVTVSEEEQPYSKVRQMVLSAQRRRGVQSTFVGDPSAVQMGFRLKSQNLLLEAAWESSWDMHLIATSSAIDEIQKGILRMRILTDLRYLHQNCLIIIEDCLSANLGKYEVEARIRGAQFFALYRLEFMAYKTSTATEELEELGTTFGEEGRLAQSKSLDRCDQLCDMLPGTAGPMRDQVKQARNLLGGATIYTTVSAEEKKMVHQAMAAEFSSTGRWYTCPNGHPFTIGNCGAPNQIAQCPECGERIGGGHGGLVGGVVRAQEFVELDQQMGGVRLG